MIHLQGQSIGSVNYLTGQKINGTTYIVPGMPLWEYVYSIDLVVKAEFKFVYGEYVDGVFVEEADQDNPFNYAGLPQVTLPEGGNKTRDVMFGIDRDRPSLDYMMFSRALYSRKKNLPMEGVVPESIPLTFEFIETDPSAVDGGFVLGREYKKENFLFIMQAEIGASVLENGELGASFDYDSSWHDVPVVQAYDSTGQFDYSQDPWPEEWSREDMIARVRLTSVDYDNLEISWDPNRTRFNMHEGMEVLRLQKELLNGD